MVTYIITGGGPIWPNLTISPKFHNNFTIFSLIPASAHIDEITWAFEVFITNFFECDKNDVINQYLISFFEFSFDCVW